MVYPSKDGQLTKMNGVIFTAIGRVSGRLWHACGRQEKRQHFQKTSEFSEDLEIGTSAHNIIIIIINEYYYGGAVALLLQDHLTMLLSRFTD